MKPINEQVRAYRLLRGLTQKELGKLLKVSTVTISQYESGRVKLTLEKAISICQVFNISLDEFTGFEVTATTRSYMPIYFSGRL